MKNIKPKFGCAKLQMFTNSKPATMDSKAPWLAQKDGKGKSQSKNPTSTQAERR